MHQKIFLLLLILILCLSVLIGCAATNFSTLRNEVKEFMIDGDNPEDIIGYVKSKELSDDVDEVKKQLLILHLSMSANTVSFKDEAEELLSLLQNNSTLVLNEGEYALIYLADLSNDSNYNLTLNIDRKIRQTIDKLCVPTAHQLSQKAESIDELADTYYMYQFANACKGFLNDQLTKRHIDRIAEAMFIRQRIVCSLDKESRSPKNHLTDLLKCQLKIADIDLESLLNEEAQ